MNISFWTVAISPASGTSDDLTYFVSLVYFSGEAATKENVKAVEHFKSDSIQCIADWISTKNRQDKVMQVVIYGSRSRDLELGKLVSKKGFDVEHKELSILHSSDDSSNLGSDGPGHPKRM